MTLGDSPPVRLRIEDEPIYGREYWAWLDRDVLSTNGQGPRSRLPRHFEFGLNHTHRIRQAYRHHWWRRWWAERSPWIDVLFFALVIAALVLAILWSGRQLEFGA